MMPNWKTKIYLNTVLWLVVWLFLYTYFGTYLNIFVLWKIT